MKKVISVLMILVMIMALAACGKKEDPSDSGNAAVTQAEENKKDAEPTKASEPTPEPTKEVTPEPTLNPEDDTSDNPNYVGGNYFSGEDDTDPAEYKVDALGNGPDVYDYDYSRYESLILSVIDMGIYYRMKIDVLDKYRVDADMIESLHVGDMLNLDGKWVTVTHIYSMDEDYNYTVDHDSFEEGCRVIVMPEKITDFYFPAEIEEAGFDENPESAEFGFVYNSYEECYIAYSDWAWDDCYVEMNYVMLYGVNLAVNESTVVHPAYYDTSRYGYDLTLTGGEFMRLRESKEEQDNRGIHFYDGITYRITLEYDAEGRATGSVADIQEVYTP